LTLAVPDSVTVSDTGFSGSGHADDLRSSEPWTAVRSGDTLAWSTDEFDTDPQANALRWGSLFNFWFDADSPPIKTTATLGLFLPGEDEAMTGATVGPS